MRVVIIILCLLVSGCTAGKGKIRAGDATVTGIPNAGTPATLDTTNEGEVLDLPAGTELVVTAYEAQPAQAATPEAPAVAPEPARTVTQVHLPEATQWKRTKATVQANTGTVDTSVAKHAADVAERRWLLWTAIACGIGGIVIRSMLPAWPSLSNGLLLGAVLAALAWKLAAVPAWTWLVALGVVGLLVAGYKRAEWDKNKDGVPDILQHKQPPS